MGDLIEFLEDWNRDILTMHEQIKREEIEYRERLSLPKQLEQYEVKYQEILPCSWCGDLKDIGKLVRGEHPDTREEWFCSPQCEADWQEADFDFIMTEPEDFI